MKKLTTNTGKVFDADWCGVSFTDNLFAALAGYSFEELLPVFQDPEETKKLTFDDDGQKSVYEGYTKLLGLQLDQRTGYVQVNLVPEYE